MKKENSTSQKGSKKSGNTGWLEGLKGEFNRETSSTIPDDALSFCDIREMTGFGKDKTYRFIESQMKKGLMRSMEAQVFSQYHDRLVRRVFYVPVKKS